MIKHTYLLKSPSDFKQLNPQNFYTGKAGSARRAESPDRAVETECVLDGIASLSMYASLYDKLEVCSCILAKYQTQGKNPDNVSTTSMREPHLPLKIQPGDSLL